MILRKGKTKTILESSIDAALLSVEIYNKPRAGFRSQSYIVLMIIAWTRLFHAYLNKKIGDTYYYKDNKGIYERINGERKSWELKTCINKYGKLSKSIEANLKFFILLRNKIEHRNINKREVDTDIFGECQALLYNYENTLVELFGSEYSIDANLVYSLQFSRIRTKEQAQSNKAALTPEIRDIKKYIENYRAQLEESTFNSQEYSIKLIQIPKISNTNRNDLAIEFVNFNEIDKEDQDNYTKLYGIIKDKIVIQKEIRPPETVEDELKYHIALAKRNEKHLPDEDRLWEIYSHRGEYDIVKADLPIVIRFGLLKRTPVFYWMSSLDKSKINSILMESIQEASNIPTRSHIIHVGTFLGTATHRELLKKAGPSRSRMNQRTQTIGKYDPQSYFSPDVVEGLINQKRLRRSTMLRAALETELTQTTETLSLEGNQAGLINQAKALDCYLYARTDKYRQASKK